MVDCVEDVVVGDAVPARRVVDLHKLIVIRKDPGESSPRVDGANAAGERDDR
jgi:hypothetical protein